MDTSYFFLACGCSFLLGVFDFFFPFKFHRKKDSFRLLIAATLFLTALWAGTCDINRYIAPVISFPFLRYISAGTGALLGCLIMAGLGYFFCANLELDIKGKTIDAIDFAFWLSYLIPLIIGYIFVIPCFLIVCIAGIISFIIFLGLILMCG